MKVLGKGRFVGATLLAALLTLATLTSGCKPFGKRAKASGKGEVFYKPPITKDQAQRLGKFLHSVDFFDGSRRKSVQLTKKGDIFQVRFVVVDDALQNKPAVRALKVVTGMAAREVLGGAQVEVHLCDARFKTKYNELLPKGFGDFGERMSFGKGELFVKKPITAALGKQLGERLVTLKFFDTTKRKSLQVTQDKDGLYRLRFVAQKTLAEQHKQAFSNIAFDLSLKVLGGAKVQVDLCDDALEPFTTLKPVEAGTRLAYAKGELFYTKGVEVAQAQQLGALLRKLDYFNDKATRAVQLRREGGTWMVGFVVRPGSEKAPATETAFRQLGEKLKPAFGEAPYKVRLVDPTFLTLATL